MNNKMWLVTAFGFILLCLLAWIGEICDLPNLLFGFQPTPANWGEALYETFAISIVGFFTIYYLIGNINRYNRVQAELKKIKDDLEIEVKRKTKELIDASEKIAQTEKLAALGELAGIIGHELRGPLGVVKLKVYNMDHKLGSGLTSDSLKEFFKGVNKQIDECEWIINNILTYSRIREPDFKDVNVNNAIEKSLEKNIIPNNIEVIKKLKSHLSLITADANQIVLALSNIVLNALQAMPDGGELTVESLEREKTIEVRVADTGPGIQEENLSKIFEPLFSTKAAGTGLGLAACKHAVSLHGGVICAENREG